MSILTDEEADFIRERTKLGLRGLVITYKADRSWFKVIYKIAKWPFILSVITVIVIVLALAEPSYYGFIEKLNESIFAVIPSLLGFLIGGYALFAGFGGRDLLKAMVGYGDSPYINYQISSSTFGMVILIQLLILAVSFFVGQIVNINIVAPNDMVYRVVNIGTIYLLNFMMFLSISLTRDIVVNIFNISQKYHWILYIEAKKEKLNPSTSDRYNE